MKKFKNFILSEGGVWTFIILYSLYFIVSIQPQYLFTGDGLNKIIQSRSLIQNSFQFEEVLYPFKDIDPDFKYYPFQGVYLLTLGNRHLGQYPVFFSALISPVVAFFPDVLFSIIGVILFLLSLFIAKKFFGLHRFTLLFITFLTFLLPLAIDFSENIYTACFTFIGLVLFLSSRHDTNKKTSPFIIIFSGFLIAAGVWLRLEGLFFMLCLAISLIPVFGIRYILRSKESYYFFISFGLFVSMFFIFNFYDYGHPLGPRFLANIAEFSKSVPDRLIQATTLLFFGNYKVGFFVYTPLFLAAILHFAMPSFYKELADQEKVLFWLVIFFLPSVSFFAPNDGVVTWGPRYLVHAVLPCCVLLDRYLVRNRIYDSIGFSRKHILIYFLLFVSVIVSFVGFKFTRVAAKQLKTFQLEMNATRGDIRIFQNLFLLNHIGMGYFQSKNLLVTNKKDLVDIISRLKTKYKGNSVAFYDSSLSFIFNEKKPDPIKEFLKGTGNSNEKGFSKFMATKSKLVLGFFYEIFLSFTTPVNGAEEFREAMKILTPTEKQEYLKFLRSNLKPVKESSSKNIETYEFLIE